MKLLHSPAKTARKTMALLFAGSLFGMAPLYGAVILEHNGSTNPTTEGWTLSQGTHPGISAQAFTDGTTPVWQINNVSSGTGTHFLNYKANESEDLSHGWELSISIKIPGLNLSPGAQSTVQFFSDYDASGNKLSGNNRIVYILYFGTTTTGNMRLQVATDSSGTTAPVPVPSSTGYQTFSLQWNPGDTSVSVLVDGVVKLTGFTGYAFASSAPANIVWGNAATSTAQNRTENWAKVQFSVIPEPSTLGLLGIAGGLMLGCAKLSRPGQR